jgi:hypothetical protein
MISRHENINAPSLVQDPQRDLVSRKLTLLNGRPKRPACRSQAATSRSRAITFKNVAARTAARPGSPGSISESSSNRGLRPVPDTNVSSRPSTGNTDPIPTTAILGIRASAARSQPSCACRNFIASASRALSGKDSVTRPSSLDTRKENRRARADLRNATSTGGDPGNTGICTSGLVPQHSGQASSRNGACSQCESL